MAQVAQPEISEADKAAIQHNKQVKALSDDILSYASDITDDMKIRQLPEGVKGAKVYGPNAACRQNFNSLGSILKKASAIVLKLEKGTGSTKKGKFIGFSAPCYIKPEMAEALGLKEGSSALWPAPINGIRQKPIFSAGMITKFFTNKVLKEGLVHENDETRFSCNAQMKKLFEPYVNVPVFDQAGNPKPSVNLDNLTYTEIQVLIRHFVEKRDKKTNPGPPLTEELVEILQKLKDSFAELKKSKTALKASMQRVKNAREDLVKAKAQLDQGIIPQSLFDAYALNYKNANDEKALVFSEYQKQATQMGI